jgi:DNA-binding MarR family transcriptional regulator
MRVNRARYLLRAATIFGAQKRGIPISFLMVFLVVALDEGLGVNEYARRFGIDRRDMSRCLKNIGSSRNYRSKFYGLVTFRKPPTNKSGKMVFLTKKGKKLFDKLNIA